LKGKNGPTKKEIEEAGAAAGRPYYIKSNQANAALIEQNKITRAAKARKDQVARQESYMKAVKLASQRDTLWEYGDEAKKRP
jgi:hypothetical protein